MSRYRSFYESNSSKAYFIYLLVSLFSQAPERPFDLIILKKPFYFVSNPDTQ